MTESGLEQRLAPKRQSVRIADLDLLVRVPGRPEAIRAYTAAEEAEARAYAAVTGGIVVPLPPAVADPAQHNRGGAEIGTTTR